ncbi:MAG: hypothetical protein VB122_04965 [Erysipelotrichales bacterium]|nr:hypothetical protein [Erysipelotrichales bacterium]
MVSQATPLRFTTAGNADCVGLFSSSRILKRWGHFLGCGVKGGVIEKTQTPKDTMNSQEIASLLWGQKWN